MSLDSCPPISPPKFRISHFYGCKILDLLKKHSEKGQKRELTNQNWRVIDTYHYKVQHLHGKNTQAC